MVYFPGFAGLHDQTHFGAGSLADQMVVHGRRSKQAGYGGPAGIHTPIGKNEDAIPVLDGIGSPGAKAVQRGLQRTLSALAVKQGGKCNGPDVPRVDPAEFFHVVAADQGGL